MFAQTSNIEFKLSSFPQRLVYSEYALMQQCMAIIHCYKWVSNFINYFIQSYAFVHYMRWLETNQITRNWYTLSFDKRIPYYSTSTIQIEVEQTPIMLRHHMSIRFENITVYEQVIHQIYIRRCKMVKITPQIMYVEYIHLCSHGKF